jgi:hypothetical protein
MQRRRALMGSATNTNEITLESPTDFSVVKCGSNFYGRDFWAEEDSNRGKTRRSIYALNGTTKSCRTAGSVPTSPTGRYYPIAIPEGATKIKSIYSDVAGLEAIIFCAIWNGGDWTSAAPIINTGWVTTENLTNIQLNSCTHFAVNFRVDSSNTYFTSETTPSMVKVVFE